MKGTLYIGDAEIRIVDNRDDLVRVLLRISPKIYHTESFTQYVLHGTTDVHPPMNKRIKNIYSGYKTINSERVNSRWSIYTVIGMALTIIGSFIIGIGYLTFTTSYVPKSTMFYGTIITLFGVMLQYLQKNRKEMIITYVSICLSFAFTLFIGFYLGAGSITGAVAQGKIGRQILGLTAMAGIAILITIIVSVVDFSVKDDSIPSLSQDWYDPEEKE